MREIFLAVSILIGAIVIVAGVLISIYGFDSQVLIRGTASTTLVVIGAFCAAMALGALLKNEE